MATFTRRTITTVRQEFVVPADQAYGATSAEIGKAWSVAEREYRQHHGLREEEQLTDDAITFRPGDDEVVLSFETRSGT